MFFPQSGPPSCTETDTKKTKFSILCILIFVLLDKRQDDENLNVDHVPRIQTYPLVTLKTEFLSHAYLFKFFKIF
jgi:hypothetical protein